MATPSVRVAADIMDFKNASNQSRFKLKITEDGVGEFSFATVNPGAAVRLTNVALPTSDSDVPNKAYVDSVATGLDMKGRVAYITVGNLVGATYTYTAATSTNPEYWTLTGTDAWSTVLSSQLDIDSQYANVAAAEAAGYFTSNLGFVARPTEFYATIDGVVQDSLTVRQDWPTRILVNDQANSKENGIYWMKSLGTSSSDPWVLQRSELFDGKLNGVPAGEIKPGAFVFVSDGHTFKNCGHVLTSLSNKTSLDVSTDGTDGDDIKFEPFSVVGAVSAGSNINVNGSEVSTKADVTFTTATVGDITIGGTGTAKQISVVDGVLTFESTKIVTTEQVEAAKDIYSTGGTIYTGTSSAKNFEATSTGDINIKGGFTMIGTDGVSPTVANLRRANFQITDGQSPTETTKFIVTAVSGNTYVGGTLITEAKTELYRVGGIGGTAGVTVDYGTHHTTTVAGAFNVQFSSNDVFSVANNTGNVTAKGTINVINKSLTVWNADQSIELFQVTEAGNVTSKGSLSLTHTGGEMSFDASRSGTFSFDATVNQSNYYGVIKSDAYTSFFSHSGNNEIVRISPGTGTGGVVSLYSGSEFAMMSTDATAATPTPVFHVGSTGSVTCAGPLTVRDATTGDAKFSVTAGGDVTAVGTATITGDTTVSTGNLSVTAGSLAVNTHLTVNPTSEAVMAIFKGNKKLQLNSSTNDTLFEVDATNSTAKMNLSRGTELYQYNADQSNTVFKVIAGVITAYAGAFTIYDTPSSASASFSVSTGGNTVVGGTLSVTGLTTLANLTTTGVTNLSSTTLYDGTTSTPTLSVQPLITKVVASNGSFQIVDGGSTPKLILKVSDNVADAATTKVYSEFSVSLDESATYPYLKVDPAAGADEQHVKFEGKVSYASSGVVQMLVDSTTGNVITTGSLKLGTAIASNAMADPKVHIEPDGSSTFNGGTHTITGATTITGDVGVSLGVSDTFKINTDKFVVTNLGKTTMLGNLEVGSGPKFTVAADSGNVTTLGSCSVTGTLDAADQGSGPRFHVNGSTGLLTMKGVSQLENTLKVGSLDANSAFQTKFQVLTTGETTIEGKVTINKSTDALAVPNGSSKFLLNNGVYKVVFDSDLATFTGSGQKLIVREEATSAHCIELLSAKQDTPSNNPALFIYKGGSIKLYEDSGSVPFMQVDASARSFVVGNTNQATFQLRGLGGGAAGTATTTFDVNMATGTLKKMGDIKVYPSSWTATPAPDMLFHVDGVDGDVTIGNTGAESDLTVQGGITTVVGGITCAGSLVVKTDQFVVNGSNIATFKGDSTTRKKVTISNTNNEIWSVNVAEGTGIVPLMNMYHKAKFVMHSDGSTPAIELNGGDVPTITCRGGKIQLTNQAASLTLFEVSKDLGDTVSVSVTGTLGVTGAVTLDSSLTVKSGDVQLVEQGTGHKFTVTSDALGTFFHPDIVAEQFVSVKSHDGSSTLFKVGGLTGDTTINGGVLKVNKSNASMFEVNPSTDTVSITDNGSATSFVINDSSSTNKFSVTAGTGATTIAGALTVNNSADIYGQLAAIQSGRSAGGFPTASFGESASGASDGTILFFVQNQLATDGQVVVKANDGSTKFQVSANTGNMQTSGSITVKPSGTTKFEVTTTGQVTAQSNIIAVDGKLQVQRTSPSQETVFEVLEADSATGGAGQINSLSGLKVNSGKCTISKDGNVSMQGELRLYTVTSVGGVDQENNKFKVLTTGETTIYGGNLKIKDSADSDIFVVNVNPTGGANKSLTMSGDALVTGTVKIGGNGGASDPPLVLSDDGDITTTGGDITVQQTGTTTSVFSVLADSGNVTSAGDVSCVNVTATGDLNVTGSATAVNFLASSDMRLKKNITPIPGDKALNMCNMLQGYTFEWTNPAKYGKGEQIGFMAQEMMQVHSCLIKEGDDHWLRVDYDKTTAILATALTEMQKQVEELRAEVKQLKAEKA